MIKYYSNIPQKTRNKLNKLTLGKEGFMQSFLEKKNLSGSILFINKKICGWSCLGVINKKYLVHVFISENYRHKGYGQELVFELCRHNQDKDLFYQDTHSLNFKSISKFTRKSILKIDMVNDIFKELIKKTHKNQDVAYKAAERIFNKLKKKYKLSY